MDSFDTHSLHALGGEQTDFEPSDVIPSLGSLLLSLITFRKKGGPGRDHPSVRSILPQIHPVTSFSVDVALARSGDRTSSNHFVIIRRLILVVR